MTHWAKFGRAYEHLAEIDSIIDRFLDMKPYRFVREYEPKPPYPTTGRVHFTLRLHAPVAPPPQLPALIGDFLTNMRASLDHLIYGIALKHTGQPEIIDNNRLAFAIYETPQQFGSWRGTVDDLLPNDVFALLDDMQPYQRPPGPPVTLERHIHRQPLWVLNAFVNADKHRTLMPVTGLRLDQVKIMAKIPGEPNEAGATVTGSFEHGDPIFDYWFFPDSPNAEVSVEPDFAPDVAFSEKWPARQRPVSLLLHRMGEHVRDKVFPKFEPHL